MMKKAGRFLVTMLAVTIMVMLAGTVGAHASELDDVTKLINDGYAITDYSSSEAYNMGRQCKQLYDGAPGLSGGIVCVVIL